MSEICNTFELIHCKDGIYDLFQNNNWIMSRGCVDSILEYISKESKSKPIRLDFKDQSKEDWL